MACNIPSSAAKTITSIEFDTEFSGVTNNDSKPYVKRSNYGKCQYKTGKCFNERTVKRNGEAHSLCEEHRVKQNIIQRRSDRKYQTVHAVRRRERSQRRAVLKKQVSLAAAQQLFYEHQQQKTMGIPLSQYHSMHLLTTNPNDVALTNSSESKNMGLAPPIQVPPPNLMSDDHSTIGSSLVLSIQHQNSFSGAADRKIEIALNDESSPTGIDDFALNMFLTIPSSSRGHSMPTLRDDEIEGSSGLADNFGFVPITSHSDDKEMWSDDDIEFLQTILLS
ncbi:uncharacterized protein PHALS_08566 [Plasmopara halstedii]|uniref:Uncharacterized protein n=1 Tax=Plasmopara halstedii TaxID=4781 RepID=A0A0P1ADC3_PLAHL|nr:uncharacterized protein PHALS_08566 [Plasmopara halstedii]CEG38495.1 hypothetical protein PHALS_08566 [Plasmopara halstedii]|eukprot:XP_024574864.1 hypothetical protein PHALS_08566 [Plasmopara halstedii]